METVDDRPLIRRFIIRGMYGYKDLGLDVSHSARVVIAENGTGKTTLLNAMADYLSGRFFRLAKLQFDAIECWLGKETDPITITKTDIEAIGGSSLTPQLANAADMSGIDPEVLLNFLSTEYGRRPLEELRGTPIMERLFQETPYSYSQLEGMVREMFERLGQTSSGPIKTIHERIKAALGNVEVIYLPTFRRIEIPLGKNAQTQQRRHTVGPTARARTPTLLGMSSQMFFGLSDVEERLSALTEEIGRKSNLGYRQISGEILDDLVAGNVETASYVEGLPSIDSLRVFFSRIGRGPETERRLARITRLYETDEINSPDNATLKYFLVRLAKIVDETKDIEQTLEGFANVVNGYLRHSSDEKEFQYDPRVTRVRVRNLINNSEIRLDDLSSGEKQVISLFALMHLTSQPKIILIDEPELSLSIEWQRKLLPDIVHSQTCRQLIAITHSPFVFENELDPYAGPLFLRHLTVKAAPQAH